ncbi:MAG TPA: HEAT repeat domain-containing protein [Spirochaetota bacterium]|nr:HEAT repeat domain-containing protein [Spirochaetota bacterium]HOM37539.1 HEAT repeat domain-containing protein [Spirochaetota bacterium]HPQ49489.1 HEAT repeat domain-containing protein [Spirochaetota bacterium]
MKLRKIIILVTLINVLILNRFFGENIDDKLLEEYKNILMFGIADKRAEVLRKIGDYKGDNKKFYSLIEYVIENDTNTIVLREALNLVEKFKISEVGDKVAKILEETKENQIKVASLRALGSINYNKVSNKVLELLDEKDPNIKRAVLFFIGETKDKKGLDSIYKILENMDEKEDVLQEAIATLGKIGDKNSIEKLKDILENPGYSKYVRMYAPISLAQIGGKEVVDIIKKATEDSEYVIRIRAIYSLSLLEGVDINIFSKQIENALKDSDVNVRLTALDVVKNLNAISFVPFLKYLISNDPELKVRDKALKVYAKIEKEKDVIETIQEMVDKKDFYSKILALDTMKEVGVEKFISFLKKTFIEKTTYDIRDKILRVAAEKIENESVFEFIQEIALNKNIPGYYDAINKIRYNAMLTLTKAGWQKSFPTLSRIAEDNNDPINTFAIKLIINLNRDAAKNYFIEKLNNISLYNYKIRYEIIKAIGDLKPEGIEDKLKAIYITEKDAGMKIVIGKVLSLYGIDPKTLDEKQIK